LEAFDGPVDASNRPLDSSDEVLDGETGPVFTSGALLEPSGGSSGGSKVYWTLPERRWLEKPAWLARPARWVTLSKGRRRGVTSDSLLLLFLRLAADPARGASQQRRTRPRGVRSIPNPAHLQHRPVSSRQTGLPGRDGGGLGSGGRRPFEFSKSTLAWASTDEKPRPFPGRR
jgi:hypothetical protein